MIKSRIKVLKERQVIPLTGSQPVCSTNDHIPAGLTAQANSQMSVTMDWYGIAQMCSSAGSQLIQTATLPQ